MNQNRFNRMKKLIFILSLLLTWGTPDSGIKGQTQTANLKFNKLIHDFGTFDIKDGKKSYTFTFTNTGSTPVVIQTVISSCGCTTPTWTKSPVLPGKNGEINVVYLNDQGAYPFEKALSVYVAGSQKPIVLKIKGNVRDKNYKASDSFPFSAGNIRFRSSTINAGMVARNIKKEFSVNCYNNAAKGLRLSAVNLPKGISVSFDPNPLTAKSSADMKVIIDPSAINDWGSKKLQITLAENGKVVSSNKIELSFVIIDNFSGMTREQISNAPLPVADKSSVDFGEKQRGTQIDASFDIKNYGNNDLVIYKVESDNPKAQISYQRVTKGGKSSKISLKLPGSSRSGNYTSSMSLYTNSPSRPVINLSIEGKIR